MNRKSRRTRIQIRFTPEEIQTINEIEAITGSSKSEVVQTMFNFARYLFKTKVIDKAINDWAKDQKKKNVTKKGSLD